MPGFKSKALDPLSGGQGPFSLRVLVVNEDRHRIDQPGNSALTITRILVPFALGYCLSYLFRAVNAVLAPDLTSELNLNAEDLGLLTATYFATFAAFQLPLGVLLDRYGPRKIEAVLLIFAAVGAYLFSQGESITALTRSGVD